MPPNSDAMRSITLAVLVVGAAPAAVAQQGNVTAFNPYNGSGLPGGGAIAPGYGVPETAGAPVGGPAFNPWSPNDVASPNAVVPQAGAVGPSDYGPSHRSGFGLPPPPPGPIESRLTAVPQRGDLGGTAASASQPPSALAPSPPPTEPVVVTRSPTEPPPPVASQQVPVQPPAATESPAATQPPAAAPSAPVASAAPPPPEPVTPPSSPAPIASISFSPQSAEIVGTAREELDRVAKTMNNIRQVELRAYATGSDDGEARKIALARALSVRSYLIDQGVKTRIEVGAFASSGGAPGGDRVDVIGP